MRSNRLLSPAFGLLTPNPAPGHRNTARDDEDALWITKGETMIGRKALRAYDEEMKN